MSKLYKDKEGKYIIKPGKETNVDGYVLKQHVIPAKIIEKWKIEKKFLQEDLKNKYAKQLENIKDEQKILFCKFYNQNKKEMKTIFKTNERDDFFCLNCKWSQKEEELGSEIEKDFHNICKKYLSNDKSEKNLEEKFNLICSAYSRLIKFRNTSFGNCNPKNVETINKSGKEYIKQDCIGIKHYEEKSFIKIPFGEMNLNLKVKKTTTQEAPKTEYKETSYEDFYRGCSKSYQTIYENKQETIQINDAMLPWFLDGCYDKFCKMCGKPCFKSYIQCYEQKIDFKKDDSDPQKIIFNTEPFVFTAKEKGVVGCFIYLSLKEQHWKDEQWKIIVDYNIRFPLVSNHISGIICYNPNIIFITKNIEQEILSHCIYNKNID